LRNLWRLRALVLVWLVGREAFAETFDTRSALMPTSCQESKAIRVQSHYSNAPKKKKKKKRKPYELATTDKIGKTYDAQTDPETAR
jgi:hypothetical protein